MGEYEILDLSSGDPSQAFNFLYKKLQNSFRVTYRARSQTTGPIPRARLFSELKIKKCIYLEINKYEY